MNRRTGRIRLLLLIGFAAIIALIIALEDHGPEPFQLKEQVYETEGTLYSVVAKNGTFPYDYAYIVQVIPYQLGEEAMKTHRLLFGNAETKERVIYATDATKVYRQQDAHLEPLELSSLQEQVGKRAAFRVAATEDGQFLVADEFRIMENRQPPAGEQLDTEDSSASAPPASDPEQQPVSETEVLAALDASFEAYHRIDPLDGSYLVPSIALLDNQSVVYAANKESPGAERTVYESTVYVRDMDTGETRTLAEELPYRIEQLRYNAAVGQLLADYYDYEADGWKLAAWEAASGEPITDPRDVLADNGAYTVFRSNAGPGLWAAKGDGDPVRISEYGMDRGVIFYPEENRFLYQAHTGKTIADGSGYGYVLGEYDLDAGAGRHYDYAIDGSLRGWSEPGRSVLVDQAFNEGVSVSYTDPRIVDVASLEERQLFGANTYSTGMTYNMAYNEATGDFTVQLPGLFIHLERTGTIREVTPWAYQGGEFTEAQPHPYSPNGVIRAYGIRSAGTSAFAEWLVLADDANRERTTAFAADALLAPLAWSADGSHYAVLADTGLGIYAGVQRTEAAFEPGGYY